jgi:protein ImuB
MEAIGAGLVQYGLWGSDGQDDQRAGWAFARVQGLLGPESVLTPVRSGGRGPVEKITLVPWGEEKVPARDPTAPWPGALPAPAPTGLQLNARESAVELLDEFGSDVEVTDRGLLSATPFRLHGKRFDTSWVEGWAGPWLLDERWWLADRPEVLQASTPTAAPDQRIDEPAGPYSLGPGDSGYHGPVAPPPSSTLVRAPARRRARLQVLTDGGSALLLTFGTDGWQVEGVYD